MNNNEKVPSFRILVVITTPKLAKKASDLFSKGALPVQYRLNAEGTASSDILDMLGLGSVEKRILITVMPKRFADIMLNKLHYELQLDTVNSGIVFTVPLASANNLMIRMITQEIDNIKELKERREKNIVTETKYVLIATVINRGFSGDVINAAKRAGASGGTILHSRQIGNEEVNDFWGINVQDEKEIILIISNSENKVRIMQEISENCGISSNAKGLVMAVPIDSVVGIQENK